MTGKTFALTLITAFALAVPLRAESEQEKTIEISIAQGRVKMAVPARWIRKQPSVRFIEHEFSIPAEQGDPADGRITFSTIGGGVKANIDRWIGQFKQADGTPTRERTKQEKKTISGRDVYVVDIRGTFADRRGPFAPAVERADYRMLGAVIDMKSQGTHYIKFYGPKKTVESNAKAFEQMVKSIKTN